SDAESDGRDHGRTARGDRIRSAQGHGGGHPLMAVVHNPILPGCFPDPSICRVGDEYFLVASTFEYLPGLPVLRSRDLVDWELIGHAIDRPGMLDMEGMTSSSGLYAPTLRFHDGL